MADESTVGGESSVPYTYDETTLGTERTRKSNPILTKLFAPCEDDALGSVHRAWAVTVLFMVIFFVVSVFEGESC